MIDPSQMGGPPAMMMGMGGGPDEELAMPPSQAAIPTPGGESDPMMGEAEPDPSEVALMLGAQIAAKKEQAHAMVEQAAAADVQQVVGMILAASQGAGVMGPGGQVA